jgi:hypothetical protein
MWLSILTIRRRLVSKLFPNPSDRLERVYFPVSVTLLTKAGEPRITLFCFLVGTNMHMKERGIQHQSMGWKETLFKRSYSTLIRLKHHTDIVTSVHNSFHTPDYIISCPEYSSKSLSWVSHPSQNPYESFDDVSFPLGSSKMLALPVYSTHLSISGAQHRYLQSCVY